MLSAVLHAAKEQTDMALPLLQKFLFPKQLCYAISVVAASKNKYAVDGNECFGRQPVLSQDEESYLTNHILDMEHKICYVVFLNRLFDHWRFGLRQETDVTLKYVLNDGKEECS